MNFLGPVKRYLICNFVAAILLTACGGGGGSSGPAPIIGTSVELVVQSANFPTDIAFLPDGRVLFCELITGQIKVIEDGVLRSTPFSTVKLSGLDAEGPLGVAVDPDFLTNGFVYVFHSLAGPHRNRIVRFRDQFGVGVDEAVIFDNLPIGGHNGGKMAFRQDGKLYVTVGDAGQPALSQDLNVLNGKILRINKDGSIPSDNPIPGSAIFALGFRNPFGMAVDTSDRLFVSENGPDCDDELNLVTALGNYGWRADYACGETNPAFVPPVVKFSDPLGLTGLALYSGKEFPEYKGHLLLADFNTSTIRRYRVEEDLSIADEAIFQASAGLGSIVALAVSPDGIVYFSTPSAVYRIKRAAS